MGGGGPTQHAGSRRGRPGAPSSFGARLRAWRERAGFSQEALAERAGLGVATLAALEHDQRQRPHPHTLTMLAGALGLGPAERAALLEAAPGRAVQADLPEPPAAAASAFPAGSVDEPGAGSMLESRKAPTNVPAARVQLIGRTRELCHLQELMAAAHLVTVTGTGGVGKTSLALTAAQDLSPHFPDGIWWVALAPLADPALVAPTLAGVLGVTPAPGRAALDAAVAFLAPREALVVLDNCEHLIEVCAEVAQAVLDGCPRVRLLATSREPLLISGEQQFPVAPLQTPDPEAAATQADVSRYPAIQMFLKRAQAVDPSFALTADNRAAIVGVCVKLAGMPLAIELAAARLPLLTPAQLLEHLDDAFVLLAGGSRTAPRRHQTLQATLDWSYDLLPPAERAAFRSLAVFAGSFDLVAVQAVSGADRGPAVLQDLAHLLNKSLVVRDDLGQEPRYRLLEPVRQYAAARLSDSGEAEDRRARHAAYYAALAERAAPGLRDSHQLAWLSRLDREHDNMRAALGWTQARGDADLLLHLAIALVPYWEVRGQFVEGRGWLEAGLAKPAVRGRNDQLRIRAWLGIGQLAFWQADLTAAAASFEQALALGHEHGNAPGIAAALSGLGAVRVAELRFGDAEELLAEGLRLHEGLGDTAGAAWALFHLGRAAGNAGELAGNPRDGFERACALLETSLAHYRRLGDVRLGATVGMLFGAALAHRGQREQAAALLRESLSGLQAVGDRAYLLSAVVALARVAAITGQPLRAARLFGAAEALHATVGANLTRLNRSTYERALAAIQRHLGTAELEDATHSGRLLSLDEALAEAELVIGEIAAAPTAELAKR